MNLRQRLGDSTRELLLVIAGFLGSRQMVDDPLGLDELVVVHRRRERLSLTLAGAALTITLALSSVGWSLARSVGQTETRLETLEQARPVSREALIQLSRLEARLEGFEARLVERLEGIERRLDRTEDAANRRD